MRSITRRPRAPSRRNPAAVMEPSGNASVAAISSRSGVSGVIFSGGGIEAIAQQHIVITHVTTLRSLFLSLLVQQQAVVASEVELATTDLF